MESKQAYREFLERLDGLTAASWEQYKGKMACKAGCSGCCRDDFRVSLIEGFAIKEAVDQLPEETRTQVLSQNEAGKCPLLVADRCSIYASRPAICRVFGFPVTTGGVITTCELNFVDEQGQDFSARAYDKDAIARTLAVISRLLLAETGRTLPEGDDAPMFTIREILGREILAQGG